MDKLQTQLKKTVVGGKSSAASRNKGRKRVPFIDNKTCVPGREWNTFQAAITTNNDGCCRAPASVSPADVDAPLLLEQDVGDVVALELQVVLDVSARPVRSVLMVSGEGQLEVAQDAAGDEALQLLPGQSWRKRCFQSFQSIRDTIT